MTASDKLYKKTHMRLNKILTGMFAALVVFSFGCKKT
ncbi:MAG: hypothetical protein RJA57_885, partial [Bacteroidota bacterium]